MKRYLSIITLAILAALLAGAAWAHTAQNSSIDRHVIGGGGARLKQGGIRLNNTLGQPVVGRHSGGDMTLCAGFWCQPAAAIEHDVYLPLVLRNVNS